MSPPLSVYQKGVKSIQCQQDSDDYGAPTFERQSGIVGAASLPINCGVCVVTLIKFLKIKKKDSS